MPSESEHIFGFSEPILRFTVFAIVLSVLLTLEFWVPRKPRVSSRAHRWWTNGVILILATLLMRGVAIVIPLLVATVAALFADDNNIGLLNLVEMPIELETVLAVVLLDLAIWAQHLLSHKIPILWRIHRVHHSDRDLDVTSALRFHPFEIFLSAVYKVSIVLLLGPAIIAVIIFEILLNACAMFNHANISFPTRLDSIARLVLVTPDMHRVHHSIHREEHDMNYGFCLSVWDRIFRTYKAQPKEGHADMTLGLGAHQDRNPSLLSWSLVFPFRD